MPSQSLYDHPAVPMRIDGRGSKASLPASGFRSGSRGSMPKAACASRKRSTGRHDQRNLVAHRGNVNNLWGMRKNVLITAVLCMAALPLLPARAQEPSDTAEIRSLELKMLDCYKQRQV